MRHSNLCIVRLPSFLPVEPWQTLLLGKADARRCRELAELTAIPEVTRELERIAKALEAEAGGDGEHD